MPAPEHPGCIYGEMNMCLRPCQQVVGVEEYRSEADRVADFLMSNGKHLLESAEHARDRLSTEMEFEEAARQHKRAQKIAEVLKLRDDVAREVSEVERRGRIAVDEEQSIELLFLIGGAWREPETFAVPQNAQPDASLDHRLRELAGRLETPEVPAASGRSIWRFGLAGTSRAGATDVAIVREPAADTLAAARQRHFAHRIRGSGLGCRNPRESLPGGSGMRTVRLQLDVTPQVLGTGGIALLQKCHAQDVLGERKRMGGILGYRLACAALRLFHLAEIQSGDGIVQIGARKMLGAQPECLLR